MVAGDNKMYNFRSSRTKLRQVSERHQHEAPLDELEPDHGGTDGPNLWKFYEKGLVMMAKFRRIRPR